MRFRALVVSLVVAMLPVSPQLVWAYKEGQSGYSGVFGGPSCSICHSGGSTPIVSLTGNTTLNLGGTGTYTFTVTSTEPSKQIAAGFDASATDSAGADSGTLIAESTQDDQLCGLVVAPPTTLCPMTSPFTDVTHTSPGKANDTNGKASWIFQWKAPAKKGNYALWAAGNSVNGDGAANIAFNGMPAIPGDASATTVLYVSVGGAATVTPTITPTPTPTATAGPPTETATRTSTPVSTSTPTASVPPTSTATPPPTNTSTPQATSTVTLTPNVPTDTPTQPSAPTATASTTSSPPPTATDTATPVSTPRGTPGDANCDGKVTAADVTALELALSGSSFGCGGADANGDMLVNDADFGTLLGLLFPS